MLEAKTEAEAGQWWPAIQTPALLSVGICCTRAAPLRTLHCVGGYLWDLHHTCRLRGGLVRAMGIGKAAEQTEIEVPEKGGPPSGAATSGGGSGRPPARVPGTVKP